MTGYPHTSRLHRGNVLAAAGRVLAWLALPAVAAYAVVAMVLAGVP